MAKPFTVKAPKLPAPAPARKPDPLPLEIHEHAKKDGEEPVVAALEMGAGLDFQPGGPAKEIKPVTQTGSGSHNQGPVHPVTNPWPDPAVGDQRATKTGKPFRLK